MQAFLSREKAIARATELLRERLADIKANVWKDEGLEAQKKEAVAKIERMLAQGDICEALCIWNEFAFHHDLGDLELAEGKLVR